MPKPDVGEVLVRVLAASMNNTEINTRLGWYSSSVTGSTADLSTKQQAKAEQKSDGGWSAAKPFPIIRGTDCCGRVVASDFTGVFAQYVTVPTSEVFAVDFDRSDAGLVTIPCACATAETMLHRAGCATGDEVFVTGASSGAGSAALQPARRLRRRILSETSY